MSNPPEPESGMSSRQRRAFVLARRAARRVLRRRLKLLRLTKEAYLKLGNRDGVLARVREDLHTMIRLVRAWARREYRSVPWKSVMYIVAAIVYFVNPVDLIPDIITGIGFVDDAAVIGAVVRSFHEELDAFRRWEASADESLEAASVHTLPTAA